MHRRILASAAAAALTFGLAACGDDGENGTVTTPPPSVSVGGSDGGGDAPSDGGGSTDGDRNEASDGGGDATAAAPDIPAPDPADYPGMDQNTPEGAEQAFRYYIAVVYWAHTSGDPAPLTHLHSPTCEQCQELDEQISTMEGKDELWPSQSIHDTLIESQESENYAIEVGYGFIVAETAASGSQDPKETKMTAIGGLNWDKDHWVVEGMQLDVSAYN
ncbi:DUF6318 family protein [Brachybacterium sp. p3-SID1565]|uniref:DUF6318 family protein n=2 Tax=Brachybacterium TaxID=43668 RepID=UPI0021A591B4|nr:DUF6318 family protein [Brachybacterium sp. p3-SID1565]MCT1386152.1 DUF6318 family protein [Brachybacterium sp. p3-SID1565]